MRVFHASLLCLLACSRSSVPAPDAASTLPGVDATFAGTTTDGGPAVGTPTACFGRHLEWTRVGGLISAHDAYSIRGCRTYRVTLAPDGVGRHRAPRSCEYELTASAAKTLDELAIAIADPVVIEAFERGGLVGRSRTPHDGTDLVVTFDGKRVALGSGVPAPLETLRRVLEAISARERCTVNDVAAKDGDASAPHR